jgi:hypothetical protein
MTTNLERALQAVADYQPIRLRTGSFAALYEHADQEGFISYVKITGSDYCGLTGAYVYEVVGITNSLSAIVFGFHLQPASPETIRNVFMCLRHPCDR